MSKADDIFYREFAAVCVALFVFTVIVFFIARAIGAASFAQQMNSAEAVASRIAPMGKVREGDPNEVVALAAPAATKEAAGEPLSGEAAYQAACAACHAASVA